MDIEVARATAPPTTVFVRYRWWLCGAVVVILLGFIALFFGINHARSTFKPTIGLNVITTNGSLSNHFSRNTTTFVSFVVKNKAEVALKYDLMFAKLGYDGYAISSRSLGTLHQKPNSLIMVEAIFSHFYYNGTTPSPNVTAVLELDYRIAGFLRRQFSNTVRVACAVGLEFDVISGEGVFIEGIDRCTYF